MAFYSSQTFKTSHLEFAEEVFQRVAGGSLLVLDTAEVDLLTGALVPALALRPVAS